MFVVSHFSGHALIVRMFPSFHSEFPVQWRLLVSHCNVVCSDYCCQVYSCLFAFIMKVPCHV